MSAQHRFSWHDLMTPDLKASHRFYTALFGWVTKEHEGELAQAGYVHWMTATTMATTTAGERGIGGMMKLDPSEGVPPHWIGDVAVESVDEAVAHAQAAGGTVHVAPQDASEMVRFAVVGDPQGAVTAPYAHRRPEPEAPAMPSPGTFCWDELHTSAPEAAAAFYERFYGWRAEAMPMGDGTYWIFKHGEAQVGGMMALAPGAPGPHWLAYVGVEDADATAARAVELGGKTLVPPTDIPGIGRFAVLMDSVGAVFGILQPRRGQKG